MTRHTLFVTLAGQRYRIERPWGEIPAGAGRVTDVTADAEGRIFVLLRQDPYVDAEAPAVIVLAPDGRRIGAWGGAEIADGHMLTCAPDGRIFVVDRDAHEIIVFDREGRRLGGLGQRDVADAPFNAPSDIAFAPDATILVADGYGASRIHRFTPEGRLMSSWGGPGAAPGQFATPHAIWVRPDAAVVVADRENNRVQVFDEAGRFIEAWTDFHKPMALFGLADGTVMVTDAIPRLSRMGEGGALVGRCRPVLNGAHGMWIDPSGHVLLAEGNPSRLTRLVPC
jgi:sugar lactone lactonase YvrE